MRFILFILICTVLSTDIALGQRTMESDKLLLENYNNYLRSSGAFQVFSATNFIANSNVVFPELKGKAGFSILTLSSDSELSSALQFADALSQLRGNDSTAVFVHSLFFKFSDYLDAAPEKLMLILSYRADQRQRMLIYFDHGLKISSTLPGVKDSGISDGPGNPENSIYGGVISGVVAGGHLSAKLEAGLKAYIAALPGSKDMAVRFVPTDNPNMLRLEAKGLKSAVTPGYREQLYITLFILPSTLGRVDINFLFTLTYAPGVLGNSAERFRDAAQDYQQQVRSFGQSLKENIRSITRS